MELDGQRSCSGTCWPVQEEEEGELLACCQLCWRWCRNCVLMVHLSGRQPSAALFVLPPSGAQPADAEAY